MLNMLDIYSSGWWQKSLHFWYLYRHSDTNWRWNLPASSSGWDKSLRYCSTWNRFENCSQNDRRFFFLQLWSIRYLQGQTCSRSLRHRWVSSKHRWYRRRLNYSYLWYNPHQWLNSQWSSIVLDHGVFKRDRSRLSCWRCRSFKAWWNYSHSDCLRWSAYGNWRANSWISWLWYRAVS